MDRDTLNLLVMDSFSNLYGEQSHEKTLRKVMDDLTNKLLVCEEFIGESVHSTVLKCDSLVMYVFVKGHLVQAQMVQDTVNIRCYLPEDEKYNIATGFIIEKLLVTTLDERGENVDVPFWELPPHCYTTTNPDKRLHRGNIQDENSLRNCGW